MLDIASIGNGLVGPGREFGGPRAIRPVTEPSPSRSNDVSRLQTGAGPRQQLDRVEVSEHAELMARLSEVPEVRWDRIEAAKAAIQQSDYIDRHLDDAIKSLLSDL
ncbi:MAG: hypothetical protein CMJ40_05640 [Phycisphaerae bacterium]|nr:hypothetical protein [Phycisphaerae bacterium]|tara:strand:- start:1432 stop:1749 length:318 start_codon:yes stop_codon:yes gene_type:complete